MGLSACDSFDSKYSPAPSCPPSPLLCGPNWWLSYSRNAVFWWSTPQCPCICWSCYLWHCLLECSEYWVRRMFLWYLRIYCCSLSRNTFGCSHLNHYFYFYYNWVYYYFDRCVKVRNFLYFLYFLNFPISGYYLFVWFLKFLECLSTDRRLS